MVHPNAVVKTFIASILIAALAACGGGGGKSHGGKDDPSTSLDNGKTPGEGIPGAGGVNGVGNIGYIYYADGSKIVRHNVATGERIFYVDTYFDYAKSASVSGDGTLIAAFDLEYHDLDIYNAESKKLARISTGEYSDIEFTAPVKFSPDNKYFTVYRANRYDSDQPHQLEFYDLGGNLVDAIQNDISAWDWLSNNEIVLAAGDTIYRWTVSQGHPSGSPVPIISLGGDDIWDLSVSPDKTKIAFIKRGATVNIVDIVGGSDRHVASILTDPGHDWTIVDLVSVRWSPNGNSILIGGRGINVAYGIRNCTSLSILPSNSNAVLDVGDKKYWLVEKGSDGTIQYSCESDLYSIDWIQK